MKDFREAQLSSAEGMLRDAQQMLSEALNGRGNVTQAKRWVRKAQQALADEQRLQAQVQPCSWCNMERGECVKVAEAYGEWCCPSCTHHLVPVEAQA